MILGVNGIRLIGKRSGVCRAIEAILRCMGELEHPFSEIRIYTPQPLGDSVKLPPCVQMWFYPHFYPLACGNSSFYSKPTAARIFSFAQAMLFLFWLDILPF